MIPIETNKDEYIFEYDSDQTPSPAIQEFQELIRYKDLLRLLITTSIITRYKRSILGIFWTLLNPLLNTIVLTIAFSSIVRFQLKNYSIYILTGLLFWNFFSATVLQSMDRLVWGSQLLKRIYMPRTIFAVSVVGNSIINLLFGLTPLFLIMLVLKHPFTPALLFIPVSIVVIGLFTLGLSLLLSTIAVFFVDSIDISRVIFQAWFFLTPIIYPIQIIPEQFLPIYRLNPALIMLEIFRQPIYFEVLPSPEIILSAIALAVITFLIGWLVFTYKSDEFAYRI